MITEATQKENLYHSAFNQLQNDAVTRAPAWLSQLRERAMQHFSEVGFPSVKEEEWKYTNVAPIVKADFAPEGLAIKPSETGVELQSFVASQGDHVNQMVFVDGVLSSQLSSLQALPETVAALDLNEAVVDPLYADKVRTHLARQADYVANGFTALNTAFINGGAFVFIPAGVNVSEPIHLLFIATRENKASFPRILIVAEENSSATVVENYVSTSDRYFTNAVVEIVVKDAARLEHFKVQRESVAAFHIANTAIGLGRNSNYDSTTITFGASISRHDLSVTMDHEGAECTVDGLYLVTGDQHADTHSVIDHRMPHCTSRQLYKGILDGKSRAVFNGKVFVRHNAQQTDAMQTNKNLLLSNEARVDTKPQLEILADDVKCAHGAAVGQISEDELFYLETRGIHPDLGRNLLTYGFAEEVIEKIKVDSIRKQLDEAVLSRLNARLEV